MSFILNSHPSSWLHHKSDLRHEPYLQPYHQNNQPRPHRVTTNNLTKKAKVEAPKFNVRLDLGFFIDWLGPIEDYLIRLVQHE